MAKKRVKNLTDKYTGYTVLDDSNGTGKFPIDNLIESVAPVFDATVDYTAGQSVMYQGELRTFKFDHPAGAWDASDVDDTNTQDYIKHCPTATDADIVAGNYIPLAGNPEWKKLPANIVAKRLVEEEVAASFADDINYDEGDLASKENELYEFNEPHRAGAWDAAQADKTSIVDYLIKRFDEQVDLRYADWVEYKEGISSSRQTNPYRVCLSELSGYKTFVFYIHHTTDLYFEDAEITKASYLAITYGIKPSGTWVPVPDDPSNEIRMTCPTDARRVRKSEGNLPTSLSKLSLSDAIVCVTMRDTDNAKLSINRTKYLNPDIKVKFETTPHCGIIGESATKGTISFGDFSIGLVRTTNAEKHQDNWNILRITRGSDVMIGASTDILGPVKIKDEPDFIGGLHGKEVTTLFKLYADGEELTFSATLNRKFNSLALIMESEIYDWTNDTHVFDRFVSVEFTEGKIRVSSSYKCVSPVLLERATNGGIFGVRNAIILSLSHDGYFHEGYAESTSPASANVTHALFCTTLGNVSVTNIKGHEVDGYRGFFAPFVSQNKTKIYMDTLYKSAGKSFAIGDAIYGECSYEFLG